MNWYRKLCDAALSVITLVVFFCVLPRPRVPLRTRQPRPTRRRSRCRIRLSDDGQHK